MNWPQGRTFAFSIMDDTDCATLDSIRPFYDMLRHYGMRTTKTIWPLRTELADQYWSHDLSDEEHRSWLHDLRRDGFEVSFHGARSGGSPRAVTDESLRRFKSEFGEYPATYANHAANTECLYWGSERFDVPPFRALYKYLRSGPTDFHGSRRDSDYYWADLCRDSIRYVRNFTYNDIVTTNVDRFMPYYDQRRPFVRAWFSASEGGDVEEFVNLLSERNFERLTESAGASIVYTHVAKGFVRDGVVDARVERVISRLASLNGWFVAVREVLEELERQRGLHAISVVEHAQLEARWVADHAAKGLSSVRTKLLASR